MYACHNQWARGRSLRGRAAAARASDRDRIARRARPLAKFSLSPRSTVQCELRLHARPGRAGPPPRGCRRWRPRQRMPRVYEDLACNRSTASSALARIYRRLPKMTPWTPCVSLNSMIVYRPVSNLRSQELDEVFPLNLNLKLALVLVHSTSSSLQLMQLQCRRRGRAAARQGVWTLPRACPY